ncbi:non-oxidative hydroxyarylic acid decarboxylases subunit D [Streptomyces tremellae]|uniref:Non-oxidative hydroxyarylic acid decarboxylases subunit D n=1 Tax=Streptomyces tremellae TaxID=1124239 RepID=A0ABP7EX21_9ACTN
MTAPERTVPEMCPRCAHEAVEHLASSPLAGVWEVYRCDLCNYTWRDTEPESRILRSRFPEKYRLTRRDVEQAPPYPGVPPLRGDA